MTCIVRYTHTHEGTLHLWSIAHYALVALRCITGSLAERAEMAERVERAESAERAERAGGPVVRRFHVRCCTYMQARKLIQRREKMCLCLCIIYKSDHQVSFVYEFIYKNDKKNGASKKKKKTNGEGGTTGKVRPL